MALPPDLRPPGLPGIAGPHCCYHSIILIGHYRRYVTRFCYRGGTLATMTRRRWRDRSAAMTFASCLLTFPAHCACRQPMPISDAVNADDRWPTLVTIMCLTCNSDTPPCMTLFAPVPLTCARVARGLAFMANPVSIYSLAGWPRRRHCSVR